MPRDIKKKAVSSVIWTIGERVSSLGIQFVSGIILARLLSPSDYGCIGMIVIFTSISNVFISGGLGSALIQKKETTQSDYSTVFYWNLAVSLLCYFVLYVSAPSIAEFYRMPILSSVLRVQSLIIVIGALTVVQINLLKKQLKFRKISIVNMIAAIVSLSITILMAYNGYGVWALVAQYISMALIPMLLYWTTNKWFPSLIFSVKSFKELFGFGVFMMFTQLINNIGRNIEGLLIGRFYNASTLGLYTKGKSLEGIAMTGVSEALNQVTYPLYSQYQDNRQELCRLIKVFTLTVSVVMMPFAFVLILTAKPMFLILYSEKWLGSVFYFQVLCLSGIAVSMQGINSLAIAAIGKSKKMMNYTLGKRIISITLLLLGLYFGGINGLLIAVVLESYISYFINGYLVSKYIGYTLHEQVKNLLPILMVAALSFIPSFCLLQTLQYDIYSSALLAAVLYLLLFLAMGMTFKIDAFKYAKQVILSFKK